MTLDELRHAVNAKEIDTVVLAMTDMQGRLQGKRFTAQHFLDAVLGHGAEGCNYLLAVDVDMNTVDGYAMASWDQGYGDFVMVPDLSTLRRTPWLPGTALLLADLEWHDHTPVLASPRQILRAQIDRLAARGWTALAATELEFMLFSTSYRDAHLQGYRDLEPANFHNIDYSILGTSRVEPLIRRIRNEMLEAGLVVENSKGECNFGQHEINFLYDDVLATADKHAVYKNGAKEIADQEGMAISFMAKYDQREGSSCHVHLSLRDGADAPVFADEPQVFDSFMAGLLATLPELTLLHAPNVNSYKRFASASFAPTAVAWGSDNRTCALRVLGEGKARRVELRMPGADVNPYLTLAALIAGGLHGVELGLPLEPPVTGNAYVTDHPRVPGTLRDARDLFAASTVARSAFGDEVVEHYLNNARVELEAFDAAVTDWERVRGFERL
jgi:glutamine synthetase